MIHRSLKIENDAVQLMWVIPITKAEREVIGQSGMQEFCWLLDQNPNSLVINPKRQCYANLPSHAPETFAEPANLTI